MSLNPVLDLLVARQQATFPVLFPPYLLAFCRIVIGLVFLFSSAGKIRRVKTFMQTIRRFRILPAHLSALAAVLFLCGEGAVVVCLGVGGPLLLPGFVLALLLLLLFCAALASVLIRNIHTSCNCFGTSEQEVTRADLWRNAGFILCALGGCSALYWEGGARESLSLAEWALVGMGALVFVLIWLQLHEIASLFHQG